MPAFCCFSICIFTHALHHPRKASTRQHNRNCTTSPSLQIFNFSIFNPSTKPSPKSVESLTQLQWIISPISLPLRYISDFVCICICICKCKCICICCAASVEPACFSVVPDPWFIFGFFYLTQQLLLLVSFSIFRARKTFSHLRRERETKRAGYFQSVDTYNLMIVFMFTPSFRWCFPCLDYGDCDGTPDASVGCSRSAKWKS